MNQEEIAGELVSRLTQAVRAADEQFAHSGGSSRHYVRDHFLPQLKEWGLILSLDENWVNPHSKDYFDKEA